MMKLRNILVGLGMLGIAFVPSAQSAPISIFEGTFYLNSPDITGGFSVYDQRLPDIGPGNFSDVPGLDLTFSNTLDAQNLGTITVEVVNHTGSPITDAKLFGFLDADIGQFFDNNTGDVSSFIPGSGSTDAKPDFWEIGELTSSFDIFNDLFLGTLSNNAGPLQGDIGLALGFDLGTVLDGGSIHVTFGLSSTDNGGLRQVDNDSGDSLCFNGSTQAFNDSTQGSNDSPHVVPEPTSLALFGTGLVGLGYRVRQASQHRRRSKHASV